MLSKVLFRSLPLGMALLAGRAIAQENPGVPWPATDGLGRSLPLESEVGPPRTNRFVGIFYFIDHVDWPRSPQLAGPYDVAKILAREPGAATNPASPLWGGNGVAHYWGEPLFGYYRGDDPWVLRRHAQMLADAGIDVLIFDTTNARSYPEIYTNLCEVFRSVRRAGGRTPRIAFMVNTSAGATATEIYRELYEPGRYPELWFQWQGKPLMICDPGEASAELARFFTLRAAHWPFTLTNTPYAWHWEATFPQPYGYTDDPQKPEQLNVSVAQNLSARDGRVVNMNSGLARGRSFHAGRQNIAPGSVKAGYNFQEQWRRAFELDPPFVLVTGWNEWVAGRWSRPENPLVFVDQYDEEFSRDVEPMRGGHGDNYYWQLVANVRRYKGAPALPLASGVATISISGGFEQWHGVLPEYSACTAGTAPRDFAGTGGTHYENHTGRNELVSLKVARDQENLYFYARTAAQITADTTNWMWLLIDADQNAATGWAGFDFIVNREHDPDGKFWLEKNAGGWNWRRIMPVPLRVAGNELQLAIPRAALGLSAGETRAAIDFKWADNVQSPGDVMDFYLSGNVAPPGRFNFRYRGP
ncbi:MAG TPA: hypothetical protein VL970_09795 [Candidatus Acidoferrales bacterium]|nr:hypothetical protein [Candidatus Acidoferrales bacterium]